MQIGFVRLSSPSQQQIAIGSMTMSLNPFFFFFFLLLTESRLHKERNLNLQMRMLIMARNIIERFINIKANELFVTKCVSVLHCFFIARSRIEWWPLSVMLRCCCCCLTHEPARDGCNGSSQLTWRSYIYEEGRCWINLSIATYRYRPRVRSRWFEKNLKVLVIDHGSKWRPADAASSSYLYYDTKENPLP